MGTSGAKLFNDDLANDVRGDYLDSLRRGKENLQATDYIIERYMDSLSEEEEPIFWFSLADTQWEYGRLEPRIKEKAEYFIEHPYAYEWKNEELADKWSKTLEKLKEKLNRPQPVEKKISKYRLYRCEWKLGDVFAYQFHGDYSKEANMYGKYIAFRKIAETTYWPGHIIPIVQFYKWIWESIPEISVITSMPLLETGFIPIVYEKKPDLKKRYDVALVNVSPKVIPKKYLTILGNVGGNDIDTRDGLHYSPSDYIGWETQRINNHIEEYFIYFYSLWSNK